MPPRRTLRSERLSVRVTDAQKLHLQTLARALNRRGLTVTGSELVEFLINTRHHCQEDPGEIASGLAAWRAAKEA